MREEFAASDAALLAEEEGGGGRKRRAGAAGAQGPQVCAAGSLGCCCVLGALGGAACLGRCAATQLRALPCCLGLASKRRGCSCPLPAQKPAPGKRARVATDALEEIQIKQKVRSAATRRSSNSHCAVRPRKPAHPPRGARRAATAHTHSAAHKHAHAASMHAHPRAHARPRTRAAAPPGVPRLDPGCVAAGGGARPEARRPGAARGRGAGVRVRGRARSCARACLCARARVRGHVLPASCESWPRSSVGKGAERVPCRASLTRHHAPALHTHTPTHMPPPRARAPHTGCPRPPRPRLPRSAPA